MREASPFSRRALISMVLVLAVSFLGLLAWSVFRGEIKSTDSVQANSFSRSALGHHAFVQLLKELGIDTLVSRNNSGTKAGDRALLLIAEPILSTGLRERMFKKLVKRSEHCLLVLPKWRGVEDEERAGWVQEAYALDVDTVRRPLEALDFEATVVRVPSGTALQWNDPIAPRLVEPQLLRSDAINPVISCSQGVLLGRIWTPSGEIFVLSDPDLLSNHGLAHPPNAVAMLTVLAEVRGRAERPVVVDETLHGFGREPSIYRALFDYPLVLATLHGLAVLAVLLWAAMGRFGPPEPIEPALGQGREVLIDNTAALLAAGAHTGLAIRRYMEFAVRETRRELRAPTRLAGAGLDGWLDRIGASRGITPPLSVLRERVHKVARHHRAAPNREVLACAGAIHRWKEEMIRGRHSNS